MQSEMADFTPVPPLGKLNETMLCLIFANWPPLCENVTSSIQAVHIEEDQAMAVCNMYRKLGDIWT